MAPQERTPAASCSELAVEHQLMDFSEKTAKAVLEAVLPGAKLTHRDQQSDGEYDFDLRYPDGRPAAVEVTRSVNQQQRPSLRSIAEKNRR